MKAPNDVKAMPTSANSAASTGSSPTRSWYRVVAEQLLDHVNERWARAGYFQDAGVHMRSHYRAVAQRSSQERLACWCVEARIDQGQSADTPGEPGAQKESGHATEALSGDHRVFEAKLREDTVQVRHVNLVRAIYSRRDAQDPIARRQPGRQYLHGCRDVKRVGYVDEWSVDPWPVPNLNRDALQRERAVEADAAESVRAQEVRGGPAMALTRCCGSIQRRATSVTCSRVSERTISG